MKRAIPRNWKSARWVLPAAATATVLTLSEARPVQAQVQTQTATPRTPPAIPPGNGAPVAGTPPASPALAGAVDLGRAFVEVADRVLPSVVSIRVDVDSGDMPGMGGLPPGMRGMPQIPGMPPGMPFPFPMPPGMRAPQPGIQHGGGSGVIVREDGVILTNNHVVQHAQRIAVHMYDGRTLRGRVVGADPASDVALIRVDATGLPAARMGDSDAVRVGEWVLAIGAPLGLERTVTHGVISATGRGGFGANDIEDYLQTDASINPGNSGGPLVNLRGEVLGINTMILGRNTGIGMAVPAAIARSAIDQILRTGTVSRGWLGVGVQDLSAELALSLGMHATHGALVNQIEANTPAARSGLRVGDVVTAIDGRALTSSSDLVRMLTRHAAGERVNLTLLRDGHATPLAVVTGERPGERNVARAPTATPEVQHRVFPMFGLRVTAMSPELALQAGAPRTAVFVAGVEPGSPADSAGMRRGDIVLRADGREVRGIGDITAAAQDGRTALLVRRNNRQLFVPLATDG